LIACESRARDVWQVAVEEPTTTAMVAVVAEIDAAARCSIVRVYSGGNLLTEILPELCDWVGLDPSDAALVVTSRRLGPDWLTSRHAVRTSVTARPAAFDGGRDSSEAATRCASRLVPRTVRLTCVGRPDEIATGEHPDLPHSRLAFPQGRHVDGRSTSRDL